MLNLNLKNVAEPWDSASRRAIVAARREKAKGSGG